MAANEVEVEWEDLDSRHVGKTVHVSVKSGATHHWGVIARMYRKGADTKIYLGAAADQEFAPMSGTSLFFLA